MVQAGSVERRSIHLDIREHNGWSSFLQTFRLAFVGLLCARLDTHQTALGYWTHWYAVWLKAACLVLTCAYVESE